MRTNGAGAFTVLSPLQEITAAPYAITASNLTGTLSASQLTGSLQMSQVTGILPVSQLPAAAVTNSESGVNLTGTFAVNGGTLTNTPPDQPEHCRNPRVNQ